MSLSPHLPYHAGLQMKSLAVHSHTASPNAAVPVACIGLGEQLGALGSIALHTLGPGILSSGCFTSLCPGRSGLGCNCF